MIEKAKKYLLEHNVLWINPEEHAEYQEIECFSTNPSCLTYNIRYNSTQDLLDHLGAYTQVSNCKAGINCLTVRLNNGYIGVLVINYVTGSKQLKIQSFRRLGND